MTKVKKSGSCAHSPRIFGAKKKNKKSGEDKSEKCEGGGLKAGRCSEKIKNAQTSRPRRYATQKKKSGKVARLEGGK